MLRLLILSSSIGALISLAPKTAHAKLTLDQLESRYVEAIAKSMHYEVTLEDVLGEGVGGWDADPRHPKDTVNCMIWLQLVLAEIYGANPAEKALVLDKIRYYFGRPAFSLRKHYIDHWLSVEPEPLRKVNLNKCGFPYYQHVTLDIDAFLKHRKFSCPLYEMDENKFELQYVNAEGVLRCQKTLPRGHYILFAVPSEQYAQLYLRETGPMGLVHAMILRISTNQEPLIYHASTSAKKVLEEPLPVFLERMKNLHRGYVFYQLDPDWNFGKQASLDLEARKL
ncbi:MAG: N-acetylmuramoyl-L-alanine amidase-like domain-containing protein, partial [Bdellovibrionota bacterium]